GYLTNSWVVSGFLLGLGQEAIVLNMGTAEQIGSHVRLFEYLLAVLLVVLAAGAVVAGRTIRWRVPGWYAVAPAAAIGLVAASQWVSSTHAAAIQAAPALQKAGRPNVLLIVMDTVRADHLGIDGYNLPTTPNLSDLARDSVVYTQAMAPSNFTLTSHASLFT